jgi:arylsulfatase A-like enzyme
MQTALIDHLRMLGLILCFLFFLASCSPSPEPVSSEPQAAVTAKSRPPLVILISIDTLRADHLSLYGYPRLTSPVLDAFASRGVVFEDASSPAPWTAPAHASMLTGLYPLRHGVETFFTSLPDEVPTLAQFLAREGYRTAAVVNSGWLKKDRQGITRDFDQYLFVDDIPDRRAPNTWITDQALEWIRESKDQPLFLFIHYYDVHSDYVSLPEYERLFVTPYSGKADGTGWQLAQASFEDDYVEMCHENYDPTKCRIGTPDNYLAVDRSVGKIFFDDADIRHLKELYDAGIRQLDNELGRLFSQIEAEGLLENTLTVITSDHGEEFMEHGRMDHFLTMYQEMLHVPLIIRGPGIPKGIRIDTPVSLVDIVPTILSTTSVENISGLDGLDLRSLFSSSKSPAFEKRLLFGEASGGMTHELIMDDIYPVFYSIRQGAHKLIHDRKEDSWFLYDLESDPDETVNLLTANSPSHSKIGTELEAALLKRHGNFRSRPSRSEQIEISEEEMRKLRALGYLP